MTYDITNGIDAISPSVVQISVAAGGAVLGTGFFVNDDGHVITAHHVIKDLGGRATVGVAIPNYEDEHQNRISGSFSLFDFEVAETDEQHDLALLRPPTSSHNPFREPRPVLVRLGDRNIGIEPGIARLHLERPRDGMAVATSGYPFGTPNLITSTGYIASAWAVELDEVPDPLGRGTRLRGVADSYLADMHINGGNSGGPVYRTAEGAVIGVCVATRGAESWLPGGDPAMTPDGPVLHNSGIASVVPAAYVRDLLAHAGSTWTPA